MDMVSVVLPTYNRSRVLPRAIESVLNQTYKDWELLIVDDNSSDKTKKVVRNYKNRKIKLLSHCKNKGAAAARNTGIKESSGKYIAFLDSDDEWFPQKLERQVRVMSESSYNPAVVYCKSKYSDEMHRGSVYEEMVSGWCPPTTSIFLIEKTSLERVGFFDDSIPSGYEDYDLWIRLSRNETFDFVDEKLIKRNSDGRNQVTENISVRKRSLKVLLDKWRNVIIGEKGKDCFLRMKKELYKRLHRNGLKHDRKNIIHHLKSLRKIGKLRVVDIFKSVAFLTQIDKMIKK